MLTVSRWFSIICWFNKIVLNAHRVPGTVVVTSFSSVQPLSRVRLLATPWIAAGQASLSITNSQSLLKLMAVTGHTKIRNGLWCQEAYEIVSRQAPEHLITVHYITTKWQMYAEDLRSTEKGYPDSLPDSWCPPTSWSRQWWVISLWSCFSPHIFSASCFHF